jgi:hypothetical protein
LIEKMKSFETMKNLLTVVVPPARAALVPWKKSSIATVPI